MRLPTGVALLALTPLAFAVPSGATTTIARPAYLNVIVESADTREQPPTFRVERVDTGSDIAVSPEVNCSTVFVPQQFFDVSCEPVSDEPIVLGNDVVITGFRCENAAVRAEIGGPMQNEYVTGTIECGRPPTSISTSCTATANTFDPLAGGYRGMCFQPAPNGPLPIRCHVDLTGVWLDHWRVTCYGTDP